MNRKSFLANLITGSAAAAIPAIVKTDAVKVETKIVEKIVREKFPQNVTEEEMAIWLAITEKRRRERATIKKKYQDNA